MNQTDEPKNWYVLHTMVGHEQKVALKLNKILGRDIDFYQPRKEMVHTLKGVEKKVYMALFPGYLFVHNDIEILAKHLVKKEWLGVATPLKSQERFMTVFSHEMERLFSMAGPDGIIPISKGVYRGDQVKILYGPLKEHEGAILFVNRRKKKARVRLSRFDMTLGLELVSESGDGVSRNLCRRRRTTDLPHG